MNSWNNSTFHNLVALQRPKWVTVQGSSLTNRRPSNRCDSKFYLRLHRFVRLAGSYLLWWHHIFSGQNFPAPHAANCSIFFISWLLCWFSLAWLCFLRLPWFLSVNKQTNNQNRTFCLFVCLFFVISVDEAALRSLVYQAAQRQGAQHGHHRQWAHGGWVAALGVAGADLGVVLLQHGVVTLPVLLVLHPSTATDDPLIPTHVLVDFPAEVSPVVCVRGAIHEELVVWLDLAIVVEEWVGTERLLIAVALVALKTFSWFHKAEDK